MEKLQQNKAEVERSNFRSLLAKNLNYFGNMPDSKLEAVTEIVANTKYEELTCVGFNPVKKLLEATIAVKLSYGYGGNLCSPGTMEYVRFFADYGSGWEDIGLAGVNVHNIPTGKDCNEKTDKPLMYVATLKFTPKRDCCDNPILPRIKAILSWQWVPPEGSPNWPPPWGNTLECNVQAQPFPWNTIFCLLKKIASEIKQKIVVPPVFEQAKYVPINLPEPPPLNLAEKAKMYATKMKAGEATEKTMRKFLVEPHRFGVEDLHAALSVAGINQELLTEKIAEWKTLNLDWVTSIAALDETTANIYYEELECLGIDNVFPERIVATFRIKQDLGYFGNLCEQGSNEYIAFWADWDNTCKWTYLNTVKVNVHDISTTAQKEGLCYSAMLPVDLTYLRRNCKEPKVARIRAVLSWAVPPSTTDPDKLEYWGNRVDAHVLINPGNAIDPEKPQSEIRNIGGIPIEDIDVLFTGLTKPSAKFAHYPYKSADDWDLGRPCPFGGRIIIEGNYYLGYYYRVRVRKQADPVNTIMTLGKDFYVERADVGYDHQVPTIDGWFEYLDPLKEFGRILALWDSSGSDMWEVQLDIAKKTVFNTMSIVASSPWYSIQLDNTKPTRDIHIVAGGDCKDFEQGSTIDGVFIADDLHFGKWRLATLPNTPTFPSNQPVATPPLAKTSPAPAIGGHGWSLDTDNPTKMKPCGYVVQLVVEDRTIRGSYPGNHNWDRIEVGFCLREKKT